MSLADDILQAARRPLRTRDPEPGDIVYVIRKTPTRLEQTPALETLISKCYTRRVQKNGIRVIVMGPGVNDFTGDGVFCTYSGHEVFLNYAAALEYAAGVMQDRLDELDRHRQSAAVVMADIQRYLAQELTE